MNRGFLGNHGAYRDRGRHQRGTIGGLFDRSCHGAPIKL
jgi:hypothetical protein